MEWVELEASRFALQNPIDVWDYHIFIIIECGNKGWSYKEGMLGRMAPVKMSVLESQGPVNMLHYVAKGSLQM